MLMSEKKLPHMRLARKKIAEIKTIRKRDFSVQPFTLERIVEAIHKAFLATKEGAHHDASILAVRVYEKLLQTKKQFRSFQPTVEGVQDLVERELVLADFHETAKAYITYRHARAKVRGAAYVLPEYAKKLALESKKYFRTTLSEYLFYRDYAHPVKHEERRETWIEAVDRMITCIQEDIGSMISKKDYDDLREIILHQGIMPEKNFLSHAGTNLAENHLYTYSHAFCALARLTDIADVFTLIVHGIEVSMSLQESVIQQLPVILPQKKKALLKYIVHPTHKGWCEAFTDLVTLWYNGGDAQIQYPHYDSLRNAENTPYDTKSMWLEKALGFFREKILARQGMRLSERDWYECISILAELTTYITDVTTTSITYLIDDTSDIVREPRREYSLENPKALQIHPIVVCDEKPPMMHFMSLWMMLMKLLPNGVGIVNTLGMKRAFLHHVPKGQANIDTLPTLGISASGGMVMRSYELATVVHVIARHDDTEATLLKKVRLATILATVQRRFSKLPYLSRAWQKNNEQQGVLGLSCAGFWDCRAVRGEKILEKMKKEAHRTHLLYAKKIGLFSTRMVTVLQTPHDLALFGGTVPYLSPRKAIYTSYTAENHRGTFPHPFPLEAPKGAVLASDLTIQEYLEAWLRLDTHYTDEYPTLMLPLEERDWLRAAQFVYDHWERVGGMTLCSSRLWHDACVQVIDKKIYKKLYESIQSGDTLTWLHDTSEHHQEKQELDCAGGVCTW
jgi:ribonucleoside-triphosphate reductase (thioredoxin)